MKYFDVGRGELIFLSSKPTPEFWDSHWAVEETIKEKLYAVKDTFVSKMTQNYLSPDDGMILEGGCGWGQYLASLSRSGHISIGVDFASKTLRVLKKYVPKLRLIIGDVRRLPFRDNSFAGYWSLGVIEHFEEGYTDIALEMSRVIREDGYLFVTFPYMSPLRKIKGWLGLYDTWVGEEEGNFHQFALNSDSVVEKFKGMGFELVKVVPHDAVSGIMHEIEVTRGLLQRMLDYAPNHKWAGYVQTILNELVSNIAGHCVLLIFKKTDKRFGHKGRREEVI